MLVVMQSHATDEQVRAVCERIEIVGLQGAPDSRSRPHRHRHHRQLWRR